MDMFLKEYNNIGKRENAGHQQPRPIYSLFGSIQDLRTGGRLFDDLLGQYSF